MGMDIATFSVSFSLPRNKQAGGRAHDFEGRVVRFGHGHELYFWALVVAMLIFGVGGGISFYEGLTRVLRPRPLEDPTLSYAVLAFAALAEGASFAFAYRKLKRDRPNASLWRTFRETKDPSVLTVVVEDSVALVGPVVAALGVFLSHALSAPAIDGVAAMVIGTMLAVVAALLVRESKSLLVGESAAPELVGRIEQVLRAQPEVRCVRGVFTMQLAPDEILVNTEVEMYPGKESDSIGRAVDRLGAAVRNACPSVKRIFIELASPK